MAKENEFYEIPDIGSEEFDNLSVEDLIVDMERRFKNGEIKSYLEYVTILRENCTYPVVRSVCKNTLLFE